jgi:hypothetical protein
MIRRADILFQCSCSFGFESHKRNNLHYLDEFTLLTSIGNVLVFVNLRTLEQTYYQGIRDGSIGALAVSSRRVTVFVF